jgi:transcriptional regulator with XRE-family HTH domain
METEQIFQLVRTLDRSDFTPFETRTEVQQPSAPFAESVSMPLESGDESQNLTLGRQFALSRGNKLSQRQLAFKTGIDHSTISKLESGVIQNPSISVVAFLVDALALDPDSPRKLLLIASLAKDRDKAYINGLLGLSDSNSDLWKSYGLNTGISDAIKPVDKIKDYKKRRFKRPQRVIAERGGIDHSSVSRFLSGKVKDISCSSFIAIARGLDLTKKQLLDLFDAFGVQRNDSVVTQAIKQKTS